MHTTISSKIHDWQTEPLAAFARFIISEDYARMSRRFGSKVNVKTISPDSATVYQDMFAKFMRWLMETNQLTLLSLTETQFYAFLTQPDAKGNPELQSAIQYRYVRLIEKVYEHLQITPNPAKAVIFKAFQQELRLTGRNMQGMALTDSEVAQFIDALPVSEAQVRPDRIHAGWKKRRDRALQCVMLGAGLRVAEAVGLHVDEISPTQDLDGSLKITIRPDDKHATSYEHVTFLRSELVSDVLAWLAERPMIGIDGTFLFPSSKAGMLNKSTVYAQVKRTFERAGIDIDRMGGRTLRNTFAVRDIHRGIDIEIVQKKLGLAEERSALAYKVIANKI